MSTDITSDKTWGIQIECLPKLNFALQQSSVPFIRHLSIHNNTDESQDNIKLQISAVPQFITTKIFEIGHLDSKKSWSARQCDINIKLNYDFFANLSETVKASLKLKLIIGNTNGDDTILAEKEINIDALAANTWLGYNPRPQLLAAFVTPNLKSISEIQRQMSALLARDGASDALNGYQSSKAHVEEIIQAAYNVLANQHITYSEPPASFDGQRIRFVPEILKEKLATCLDISLLFASVLEQCGLHPLILLTKDHAFIGCHAVNTTFDDAFFKDLQAVRKRVELDEIFVFEATCVLGAKPSTFDFAKKHGVKKLEQDDFEGVLDIKQARKEIYNPLPLNDSGENVENKYKFEDVAPEFDDTINKTHDLIEIKDVSDENLQQGRLERWRNKLLDLSKNNRLLNFRESAKVVPLILHDIAQLEDYLHLGKKFYLHPETEIMSGTDQRDYTTLAKNIQDDPISDYLKEELKSSRIHSSYDEGKLNSKLLAIFRQARADIEEGGCNTLYIALGFLEWCEKEDVNKRHCKSPILLVPVKLERKSISEGFTLTRADEDTVVNITLLEMLSQDFGMHIAGINPDDLPKDDSGVDVKKILQLFQYAIKDTPGWEVKYEAWLGCFSFQKILMYNDLKNRTDELVKNPIVDHILNHPTEEFDDKIEMVSEKTIDESIKTGDIFCPLSADSSQISAVLSAEKGKSFILFGPPGTGKSQTITNIIAHCLATKKKVLFVSEKKAALEVVYKRLQSIGLEPFCLELHSNKSGKTEVMRQFKEILNYDASLCDTKWDIVTKRLDSLRDILKDYVEAIHKKYPNGFTPYQAFSFLIAHNDKISAIPRLNFKIKNLSEEDIQNIRDCAKDIEQNSQKFSHECWNMLECVKKSSWTPAWRDDVQYFCSQTLTTVDDLVNLEKSFAEMLGINNTDIQHKIPIIELAEKMKDAVCLPRDLYCDDWEQLYPILQKFTADITQRENIINKLNKLNFEQLIKSGERNLISSNPRWSYLFKFTESDPVFRQSASNIPWHNDLTDLIQKHLDTVRNLKTAVKNAWNELGYSCPEFDEISAGNLLTLWRLLQNSPEIPETFFSSNQDFISEVFDLCNTGTKYEQTSRLLANFNLEKIRSLDVYKLHNKFEQNKDASNLFQKISRSFALKKIRSTLINNSIEITYENTSAYLKVFVEYIETYKKIRSASLSTIEILNTAWEYEKTDWIKLYNLVTFFKKLNDAVYKLVGQGYAQFVFEKIKTLISTQYHINKEKCNTIAEDLASSCTNYQNSMNNILKLFLNNWETEDRAGKLSDLLSMQTTEEKCICTDHCDFIESIMSLVNINNNINKVLSLLNLSSRLEHIWNNGNFNVSEWQDVCDTITTIEKIIKKDEFAGIISDIRISSGNILSSPVKLEQIKSIGKNLVDTWKKYTGKINEVEKILDSKLNNSDIIATRKILDFIVNHLEILHSWCNWNATCKTAEKLQLDDFVKMAMASDKVCSISLAAEIAMFQKFTYEVYDESATLQNFLGDSQNKRVQEFQHLDDLYTQLACQKIQQLVTADLPSIQARTNDNATSTELGKLRSAVNRQKSIMPVRKLLSEFSSVALRLKPCMLMSPLSVAQYLPPERSDFDLVIFDEASQITPWDALGAIARGKQLIVVGDQKQLPPTNFFQRQDGGITSETDDIPDERSILDECIGANMKSQQLKWHYRSRHEGLIAFSNHHYYGNGLLTFPAAQNNLPPLGVNFCFVEDGIYADKSNRIEAQTLVDNVVKTLQSPYFQDGLDSNKGKSLGIITFNQTQQELIEDLLDDARRKNPDIEPFFQTDYFEPVFVKNIENVQGDERDFIFFSICFAKSEKNKCVSMNFGPLNKEGGERRLNVAVTRAKESIFVFSSIHYDELDLNRTKKTGPAHLKNFLEYAEKGTSVLGSEITEAHISEYDSPFEKEVAQFLRNNGYEIHTQVGTSGYRIDLAVVSKTHPGRYALGIECDGAFYHRAATVRDRDKLRQRILEGLGWNIIRVWSTDWWHSPEKTKRNLLNVVALAIEKDAGNTEKVIQCNTSKQILEVDKQEKVEEKKANNKPNTLLNCEKAQAYPSLDYLQSTPIFNISSQEDFYNHDYDHILHKQIQTILENEAPITEELLAKRMISIWKFQRAGELIKTKLEELFSEYHSTRSKSGKVYWIQNKQSENYENIRLSTTNERKLEEIPVEELKNAMEFLLSEYGKFDDCDELFRLTGKMFGFIRLTEQARSHYKTALDLTGQSTR